MSKRANRKFSISRRIGQPLWGEDKKSLQKRNYPPGQHGVHSFGKRKSEYGVQLLAKQKLKMYYGDIREKQFKSIFAVAKKLKGDTGKNLIGLLESRLDAFIYRCKLVPTIFAARQFVTHKHIRVNGSIVNIPSYRLKVTSVVEIIKNSRIINVIMKTLEKEDRQIPDYINFNKSHLSATYTRIPSLDDVPYPVKIEPHHIVEFYSR